MPFDMLLPVDDVEAREMTRVANENAPGWFLDSLERDMIAALQSMTARNEQRAWLNMQLRPFGFYVVSYRNWRGREWGVVQ